MRLYKRHVAIDRRIGERILLARRRLGLTQLEVAARVPMSPTAFNRLERGLQSVSAECLGRLATILGISSDAILGLRRQDQEDDQGECEPAVAAMA